MCADNRQNQCPSSATVRGLIRVLCSGVLIACASVTWAGDWTVVQSVTLSNNLSATQTNTNGGQQAVNTIFLDLTIGSVGSAHQSVAATDQGLSLTQQGTTQSSIQSLNAISAFEVTDTVQQVSGFNKIALTQSVGAGANNIQTLNYVKAGTVGQLSQSVTGTAVTLDNSATTGTNNLQVLNYLRADNFSTGKSVSQTVNLDELRVESGSLSRGMGVNYIRSSLVNNNASQTATIGTIIFSTRGNTFSATHPFVVNRYQMVSP